MKLKQEDRKLLREFFMNESEWMKTTSLLQESNLLQFKEKFLNFISAKQCEDNLACKLFIITLQHELLSCEERNIAQQYFSSSKRAKLNYRPLVSPATDNKNILQWVDESKVACEVSAASIMQLNASIRQKTEQNMRERDASYLAAKGQNCKIIISKRLS